MKKVLLLLVLALPVLSCKKDDWASKGYAARPKPGSVPIPAEVYKRFYAQVGILYDFATIVFSDSPINRQFYIYNYTDIESYPADTIQYKVDSMDDKAINIFDSVFYTARNNEPFLKAYDLIVEKFFKVEQRGMLRKSLQVRYKLTDSLFSY